MKSAGRLPQPHPIVAGIEASDASRAAAEAAVELAADLDAPLVFVHVRRAAFVPGRAVIPAPADARHGGPRAPRAGRRVTF
jgi:nucleotide-binding universal stress UspA family protein